MSGASGGRWSDTAQPVCQCGRDLLHWRGSSLNIVHSMWHGRERCERYRSKRRCENWCATSIKHEVETLLATPDRTTAHGQRNYALLPFLYNSARAPAKPPISVSPIWNLTRDIQRRFMQRSISKQRHVHRRNAKLLTRKEQLWSHRED
jgi:hypothetical protein